MADAAVEFLLNNLKDLVLYHSHLISGAKKEIESLETDLQLFNAFLKDSLKKRRKDDVTKVLVKNIRNVVYDVEDAIDVFVTQAIERSQSRGLPNFWKPTLNLHTIGKTVETLKVEVERTKALYATFRPVDDDKDKNEKPEAQIRQARKTGVVGFEDVTEELIHRLTKKTDYFDVVSLIGMFGLGKTTLAWKVFHDPAILYEFPVRIWLVVSQEFSDKDIFLAILKDFTPINDDIRQLDDTVIAGKVATYLDTGNFLIVMDDVWATTDWDRLRLALPNGNNKGKVLITSRIKDVGTYASNPRSPIKLRFFTENESWELLQLEALRELKCPSDLESVGRQIAKACDRLPLTVVIIGGILGKYTSLDIYSMKKSWEKVLGRVGKYLISDNDDKGGRLKQFISLSYDRLPYHLRACFLYLGVFPEDYKIPVSKLIRMWIAEGFIQHDDVLSLEETAETYLEDLINRNLVTVDRFKANGYKVKTCRVHDTLRDFCRTEAGNGDENFLQEIKFNRKNSVPPVSDLQKYRHLSIHSNCLDFISSKPSGPRVRSFVCFAKDKCTLPEENIANILGAFKLVRVLDVKPLKFTKITRDMYKLVHARYIALSCNLLALPSKFSDLWNIQTLIIDTTSRTLEVKADIWKLTRLRHFKTKVPATLPKPGKNSKHGAELQTLGLISVESCTTELLERACNLQKLAISGKLSLLLEGRNGSLATMGKMEFLEKLKLVNDVYPRPAPEGRLSGLPQSHQFPSKLKSLTLVATFLGWNSMNILGLLQQLEVLKLKQNAFAGSHWKATGDGDFQSLVFLQIEETDLCIWEASSSHFPRLKGLVLKNCDDLLDIPIQLAEVASLQKLELFDCRSAAVSAKRIQEAKKKTQPQAGFAFDLSIFPPNE